MKKSTVIAGLTRNPLSIVLLLFLIACTEPFDIKTNDSAPVIVINSIITDELKVQEVNIIRSSPYFDATSNQGISGATVAMRSGNTTYSFQESATKQGLYLSETPFSAVVGATYFLTVEVDFDGDGILDRYDAQTTILLPPAIDSLKIKPVELFGHKNHQLYVYAQDPPAADFYIFNVALNDSLLTTQLTDFIVANDRGFNDQYVEGDIYLFDDLSEWATDTEEQRKKSIYLREGDVIDVQIGLISEGYFDFIKQCSSGKDGENPMFGGPASNVVTNISKGGVGYFAGYAVSRERIVF
jgi:hypothetical protein